MSNTPDNKAIKGKLPTSIRWTGVLLLILTSIFPIGLVLAFLCTHIPPSLFWIPGIFGLLFPMFVLGSLVIGIIYMFFGKKRCLLFFLALVLNFNNITHFVKLRKTDKKESTASSAKLPDSSNKTLRICSYNVCLMGYYCQDRQKAYDNKDSIVSFLSLNSFDILSLQEFYESKNNSFKVSPILKKNGFKYRSKPGENAQFKHGNIIFSKYPIISQDTIEGLPKLFAMYVDILIDSNIVRVYTIHLSSLKLDDGDRTFYEHIKSTPLGDNISYKEGTRKIISKVGSAARTHEKQVKLLIEHINNSPYAILVCGDMNENPISFSYAYTERRLNDVFLEKGRGIGQTYRGFFPSYRIDYIFYKNQGKSNFRLTPTNFKTHSIPYSDHKPISAEFNIL